MKTWQWPDHVISKSESRRLREEHNALVNVCDMMLRTFNDPNPDPLIAFAVIEKARAL